MEASQQPAQMTQEWWDLHYKVFGQWDMGGDPRRPGGFGGAAGSLSGGFGEADLDAAVACVMQFLGSAATSQTQQRRRPRVVVLGCRLSQLVWSLADQDMLMSSAWRFRECLWASFDVQGLGVSGSSPAFC